MKKKDKKKTKILNIDSSSLVIKNPIYIKAQKSIYITFDKIFNKLPGVNINLNQFNITKAAYNKNSDDICKYSNIFLKYYDEDNEFLSALMTMKYQIDSKSLNYTEDILKSDILEYLLTDSIIEKIYRMVDDYYSIDLTPSKKLKDMSPHALQFCNEHGKTLMALAIAYKLTIPLLCHFYSMKSDKLAEIAINTNKKEPTIKKFLYRIFASYIPLFENGFDMFTKLVMIANSHLTVTKNSEKVMWNRAINRKITTTTCVNELTTSIIVDLIPKAIFKKNIIYLIQVAIPQQIRMILIAKDQYEYCDISMVAKNDELSGLEKMEANSAKISDLDVIISKLNIEDGIKRIKKKYDIKISKEEIKYYKKHLHSFAFEEIILQFFAKYFGGIYDLKSISRKDYIKLVIIFKKTMTSMGFIYIHQIMTGNISSTIKKRRISSKQLKKIESSYKFQKVMEKYSMGMDLDSNSIIKVIAALINTPIEYVDFSHPDRLNQNIIADADIVADEYLRFIQML